MNKNFLTSDISIMQLLFSADLVSKVIIFILLSMSIISWAIIIGNYIKYKQAKKKMFVFEEKFWSIQTLDNLLEYTKRENNNPLSSIFITAINEDKKSFTIEEKDSMLKIGVKDRIMQAMLVSRNREMDNLNKGLNFLASTGSVSPFIGLFGTVWGIINSFQSIAISKNTNLAVVAPGISEALLVTAIGLAVAIPAVLGYNLLTSQLNLLSNKIDDFISELYNILSRSIDKK